MQPRIGSDFRLMQLAKMTVNRAIMIAIDAAVADRVNPILPQVTLFVVVFTIMRMEVGILLIRITARYSNRMFQRQFEIANGSAAAEHKLQAEKRQ